MPVLIGATQHHNQRRAAVDEIHPVAGTVVDPEFAYASADQPDIAGVAVASRANRAEIRLREGVH